MSRSIKERRYFIFNRDAFKEHRVKSGMTRDEMAQKLGRSKRTIESWETGIVMPSSNHVVQIANALRIPIETIAFDRERIMDMSKVYERRQEMRQDVLNGCEQVLNEFQNTFADNMAYNREAYLSDKGIDLNVIKNLSDEAREQFMKLLINLEAEMVAALSVHVDTFNMNSYQESDDGKVTNI